MHTHDATYVLIINSFLKGGGLSFEVGVGELDSSLIMIKTDSYFAADHMQLFVLIDSTSAIPIKCVSSTKMVSI